MPSCFFPEYLSDASDVGLPRVHKTSLKTVQGSFKKRADITIPVIRSHYSKVYCRVSFCASVFLICSMEIIVLMIK